MSDPNPNPYEKKICVAASSHTCRGGNGEGGRIKAMVMVGEGDAKWEVGELEAFCCERP